MDNSRDLNSYSSSSSGYFQFSSQHMLLFLTPRQCGTTVETAYKVHWFCASFTFYTKNARDPHASLVPNLVVVSKRATNANGRFTKPAHVWTGVINFLSHFYDEVASALCPEAIVVIQLYTDNIS